MSKEQLEAEVEHRLQVRRGGGGGGGSVGGGQTICICKFLSGYFEVLSRDVLSLAGGPTKPTTLNPLSADVAGVVSGCRRLQTDLRP